MRTRDLLWAFALAMAAAAAPTSLAGLPCKWCQDIETDQHTFDGSFSGEVFEPTEPLCPVITF